MNLSAVILAGGESRRMGSDKAFLPVNGQPLITRMVATVRQAGIERVFISGRAGQDYPNLGCAVLYDREQGCGPLGGLERALDSSTTNLLLVLAVDFPLMNRDVLERLAAHCDALTGAVPELDDGLQPLAAIYPRRCHEIACACLAHNRLAAREFAEACLHERAVRRWRVPPRDQGAFLNWNRPEDLPASCREPCSKSRSSPAGRG
jgi:molybdopterin-guanine dinucleotide biosynthesis protein A